LKRGGTSYVIANKKNTEELKTHQLKSEIEEAYMDKRDWTREKAQSETMMEH
jgi:hypothetical protein